MKWPVSLLLVSWIATAAAAADYVWIEGEKPTSKNFARPARRASRRPQFLSEREVAEREPARRRRSRRSAPRRASSSATTSRPPSAGKYEIWNRIGMEFVRSPFDWRIDQGEWKTITPAGPDTDLMEVGFWNEVAWIKMGEAGPGGRQAHAPDPPHADLSRRRRARRSWTRSSTAPTRCASTRALSARTASSSPTPTGRPPTTSRRPARSSRSNAGARPAPAERVETPLGGLWQVCRYDEQEVVDRAGPTQDAAGRRPRPTGWRSRCRATSSR